MVGIIMHSTTSQLAYSNGAATRPGIILCYASKHDQDNDCENASTTIPLSYGGWESNLLRGMTHEKIQQNIRCLVKWSECRAIAKKPGIRSRLHPEFRPVRTLNQKSEIHLSEEVSRDDRPSRRDTPNLWFLHQWKSDESCFRLQDKGRCLPWRPIWCFLV